MKYYLITIVSCAMMFLTTSCASFQRSTVDDSDLKGSNKSAIEQLENTDRYVPWWKR